MKIIVTERIQVGSKAMERSVEITPAYEMIEGEPTIDLQKLTHYLSEKLSSSSYAPQAGENHTQNTL